MANAFVPGVLVGGVGALLAVWWAGLIDVPRSKIGDELVRRSNPVVATDVPVGTEGCEHTGWTWDMQPVFSKPCFKGSVETVVKGSSAGGSQGTDSPRENDLPPPQL